MIRDRFRTVANSAPRTYWFVWWGTLVNRLGGFVGPLFTMYLMRHRHLAADEVGTVMMALGAGQIAASITGGQLTDRLGRRATMLVSLFGGAIAMVALGRAHSIGAITVLGATSSFVGELCRPAVFAFVSDVVPEKDRLYAFGLLYWAVNLGFAFASVVAGIVADYDFSILFYADAATTFIYGVIVAFAVPETRPEVVRTHQEASDSPLLDGQYMIFVAIALCGSLVGMQAGATLAAHMTWQGFAASTYGFVIAVNGVLIILLQPALTRWCEHRDPSRVLAGSALLFGVAMLGHGLAPIAIAHAGAVALWTFGEILESPMKSSLVAAMAPPSARGRYQGLLVMTWGVAQLVGPKAGLWVWSHAGPSAIWVGSFGLGVLVATAYLVTGPARRRRLARA